MTLAGEAYGSSIRNATENFQTPQSEPRATATEILSKATGRSLDTQELNKSVRAFAFGYLDLWDRIRKEVSETTVFSELKTASWKEKKSGRIHQLTLSFYVQAKVERAPINSNRYKLIGTYFF